MRCTIETFIPISFNDAAISRPSKPPPITTTDFVKTLRATSLPNVFNNASASCRLRMVKIPDKCCGISRKTLARLPIPRIKIS